MKKKIESQMQETVAAAEGAAVEQKTCNVSLWRRVVYYLVTYGSLFLSVLIIVNIMGMTYVPSSSMSPTIHAGDMAIYLFTPKDKITYDDIIIIDASTEPVNIASNWVSVHLSGMKNKQLCKRVIGLPGDVIEVKDGYVWRNGEKLDPDYLTVLTEGTFGPYTVPEGRVFCMGDNRNASNDSRAFGALPIQNIIGKIIISSAIFR